MSCWFSQLGSDLVTALKVESQAVDQLYKNERPRGMIWRRNSAVLNHSCSIRCKSNNYMKQPRMHQTNRKSSILNPQSNSIPLTASTLNPLPTSSQTPPQIPSTSPSNNPSSTAHSPAAKNATPSPNRTDRNTRPPHSPLVTATSQC